MLDNFSTRARHVLFVARLKAGERGAAAIDIDDLIHALIFEDQGMLETVFSSVFEGHGTPINAGPSHVPFFSSTLATQLLAHLEKTLPRSQPVSLATEIPLSPSVESACNSAEALQARFQHNHIEPLHLLGAVLSTKASPTVKLLQSSGITEENVLAAISDMPKG
jgi:ATP-dependent Clp protease ATP-binding subunit ClpA